MNCFATVFDIFEMWKHYEMCAAWARDYATRYIENGNMSMTVEKTEESIHCLKRNKEHMLEGMFVDFKINAIDDFKYSTVDDSIKKVRTTLRTTTVLWNPHWVTQR